MNRLTHALVGLSLSALALAATGCSGGDDAATVATDAAATSAPATAAPTTAPPATEAPTTAAPTTAASEDFGQLYIDNIAAYNCAWDALVALEAEIFGEEELTEEAATAIWTANREAIGQGYLDWGTAAAGAAERFTAITWPDNVQPDIDEMVGEFLAEAEFAPTMAAAADYASYIGAEWPPFGESSTRIRKTLGLPTSEADTTDFCALAAS